MHIKTRTALTALPLATVMVLASCSTSTPADPATATTTVDAGASTTETSSIEPTPEPTTPIAGETVAKDAVEELRDQGVNIYVPASSDTGIVVDPAAPLPEEVVADVNALAPAARGAAEPTIRGTEAIYSKSAALGLEMDRAGLAVFTLEFGGDYDAGGNLTRTLFYVSGYGVPGLRDFFYNGGSTLADTREGALAMAQVLFDANPGVPVIDLTK